MRRAGSFLLAPTRSPIWALVWLAVLALAADESFAVDNRYIAMGDSITLASSWPAGYPTMNDPPVIFDCVPGCGWASQSERDQCGVARRLEDWLAGGPLDDVLNAGFGGEQTSGGVVRLPVVLNDHCPGSPGPCVAVLLMHGTNDMFASVSPETARDNLGFMIDEARSRNIDTVLMTIIRRGYDPGNARWAAYSSLVVDLAAAENLQLVDSSATLCVTTPCYNTNYWIAPHTQCVGGDPNPGHLDPQGYDAITDLIKVAFPAAEPLMPAPAAPAGDVCDVQPRFSWPEVATARWYELEVDGATSWWEASAHCAGGTCTADPGVVLAAGPHMWRVRGRNLRGLGAWSADTAFTVGVPPAPAALAPTGELFASAPTYQWQEVACATEYDLEVRDALGNLDYQATNLPAAVCAGGQCSHQGTTLSVPDDYTLKVLARNTIGAGPLGSPGAEFTILACDDPSQQDLSMLVAGPSPVTTTESVTHCGPVTAGAMPAYVIDTAGVISVHNRDGFSAANEFTVKGTLTIKSP